MMIVALKPLSHAYYSYKFFQTKHSCHNGSKISKQISKGWGLGFLEDISFPVVVRVMFKLYKVPECDLDGKHTKYLNSKVMKTKASLENKDALS
jgi:hypothetical protein